MKAIRLSNSSLECSRLAYGCWRLAGTWDATAVGPNAATEGRAAVRAAYEAGYTLFDHADIYCGGVPETIFGQVLKDIPGMRERVILASKCGIRFAGHPTPDAPYRYDFSRQHIISSCEQSLRRLGVDMIDLYQLHRPDYLMDPEEVATAFDQLGRAGKVREFGVSNFRPSQLAALQSACPKPLIVNQVEISLGRLDPFEDGTLDQCLAKAINPLAWSPLAGGQLGDGATRLLPSQQNYKLDGVLKELDSIGKQRGAGRTALALAWLLKHPAGIVPIVGSVNPARIRAAAQADTIELTREEWYRLLAAARGARLP